MLFHEWYDKFLQCFLEWKKSNTDTPISLHCNQNLLLEDQASVREGYNFPLGSKVYTMTHTVSTDFIFNESNHLQHVDILRRGIGYLFDDSSYVLHFP